MTQQHATRPVREYIQGTGPAIPSTAATDMLRGFAIAGVIAIHTAAHFPQDPALPAVSVAGMAVDIVAHYAVPLFVLLSGLVLSLRYPGGPRGEALGSFYSRRLSRIVPAYLIFSLAYLALFALEYEPPPPQWVVLSLLTGNAYYHLWFVAMLIQLYALFPLLAALLANAPAAGGATFLLAAALAVQVGWTILVSFAREVLPQRPLVDTLFSDRVFLSHVFYFVLGMYAGRNWPSLQRRMALLPGAALALLVPGLTALSTVVWSRAIVSYGSLGAAPAGEFALIRLVEPLLYLATIVLLWKGVAALDRARARAVARSLGRLGALAYTVYLVHVFFQWALARLLAGAGIAPDAWGFYPIMFFLTLALSWGFASLAAHIPYGEYLFGTPREHPKRRGYALRDPDSSEA